MQEHELIEVGMYCESLMNDDKFNDLVKTVVDGLSQEMLNAESSEEREKIHSTYLGLKALLGIMGQFVLNKDQIAALKDERD